MVEVLDDGERFRRGDDREGRFLEVPAHDLLFRTPQSRKTPVVGLDDREVGVEDQDQILREAEERREGYALRKGVDLRVADEPRLDVAFCLQHLKMLRDRVPVCSEGSCDLGDRHALRPEPEGPQGSSRDVLLRLHTTPVVNPVI